MLTHVYTEARILSPVDIYRSGYEVPIGHEIIDFRPPTDSDIFIGLTSGIRSTSISKSLIGYIFKPNEPRLILRELPKPRPVTVITVEGHCPQEDQISILFGGKDDRHWPKIISIVNKEMV